MKIAVVNWTHRKVGGAETYLADILPRLRDAGEDLGFWCEVTHPLERKSVVPEGVPVWCAAEMGTPEALAALRRWSADVLYVHGLTDPAIEAQLASIAPVVFYAHGYYGTCISGSKTVHRPEILPCGRIFGWKCMAHFYPKRCGGYSPLTMISDYRLQKGRLERLKRYGTVLCASTHMRNEYLAHGLDPSRVRLLPYPIQHPAPDAAEEPERREPSPGRPWRIVCAGRIEPQKGGDILLNAIPLIRAQLDRPLELIFAGDGRDRQRLERRARELMDADAGLRISFTGWMEAPELMELIRTVDLLAVPSIWPEPFGMIGVEAGHLGVPSAAFAVGGIPEWLEHGSNGMLAPASPPTADGFATAVVRCLDPRTYPALSAAARLAAARFSAEAHLGPLRQALADAASFRPSSVYAPAAHG